MPTTTQSARLVLLHLDDPVARARQVRRRRGAWRRRRRGRATRSGRASRAPRRGRASAARAGSPATRLELGAPLRERPLPDGLALPDEHVEDDVLGRDLGGEPPDPRLGRVEPHLHRVEVERALADDHDLAVERRPRREQLAERPQLGEVAQERPLVPRPERKLVVEVLEHAAEAVPLRLVRPLLALGELAHELGLHRRERQFRRGHAPSLRLSSRARWRALPSPASASSRRSASTRPRPGARRSRARAGSTGSGPSTPTGCRSGSRREIKGFDPLTVVSPKEARKLERYVLIALVGREGGARRLRPHRLRPDAGRDRSSGRRSAA